MTRVEKAALATLQRYSEAAKRGIFARERLPHAGWLERRGLVEWVGVWCGTSMYRITPAGETALKTGQLTRRETK